MLRNFLTEEVFWNGIIHYLKKHSYKNAKNKDLWDSLANTCSEEDFTSGKYCHRKSEATQHVVPVVCSFDIYITSHSKNIGRHLMKNHSDTIELEEDISWVKFNVDMNGYYIVHYEENRWDNIIKLLNENHTLFSYKDRANLIHNAFQLVSAGRLSLDRALNLTRYLQHETSNIVLLKGLGYLEVIYRMMERRNISDIAESLKSSACDLQYLPCIQKANELFNKWMESGAKISNIPSDVLGTVYSIGAKTAAGWNFLLDRYKVSISGAEQRKIYSALASSKDVSKLTRLLELGMEGEIIKIQDLPSVIYSVSTNPAGQLLAWNFVKKNWSRLLEKFPLGSFSIRIIIVGTTSQFSSKQELEEVKLFFQSVKEEVSQLRTPQIALENIEKT